MPVNVQNAKNFLLTTDFPIDKVIWLHTGSTSVNNGTVIGSVNIPGLPFVSLPMLVWSNTSDFSVAYTSGDIQYTSGDFDPVTFQQLGQSYNVTADATNISISLYNRSGSTKTIFYRIFCFMPSFAPEDSIVPFTADQGDPFILSTDYNYMKLYRSGNLPFQTPPVLVPFNHNLGYIPRAFVWGIGSGNSSATPMVTAQVVSTIANSDTGVYIDNTSITWQNPGTFASIEYRLYLDEGS